MILCTFEVSIVFGYGSKESVLDDIDVRQVYDIRIFVKSFKSPLEKEKDRFFFAGRIRDSEPPESSNLVSPADC